ncbi:DUF1523 family protein [Candidatus Woesearchaeota archaeon]|nr:DUF1523 family protein [Candidatus Woesearchaeota archaeon]
MVKTTPEIKNMKSDLEALVFAGALGVAVLGFSGCTVAPHFDRDTYTGKVTEKLVKRTGSGESAHDKYLICTKLPDGSVRVFENTDSTLEWKFNSSDLYAKMEAGKSYKIKTYGWRVPFLSMYENIVDVEEAKNGQ